MTTHRTRRYVVLSVVMIAIAALVGLPLYYIVVNTLKTQDQMVTSPLGLPSQLYLGNYQEVFANVPLARAFLNTLYVTMLGVAIQLVVGAMAAYGMIMRNTRFNRVVGAILLLAFVVPGQATLVPLYLMLVDANQVDTLTGLVIMYLAGAVFCFFLIQGYMTSMPYEIIEAAKIDGATSLKSHLFVIVPTIRGVLFFVSLISIMDVLRTFDQLIPLAPQAVEIGNESIMLYIYNIAFREGSERLGLGSAVSVLTILLILIMLTPFIRDTFKESRAAR